MAARKRVSKAAAQAKESATAASAPAGQRSPAHAITHTARILQKLTEAPKHKGRRQFEDALEEYQAFWQTLPLPARRAAEQEVAGVHDMTPDAIRAAVSHLEG
jgi:hypothetical protein